MNYGEANNGEKYQRDHLTPRRAALGEGQLAQFVEERVEGDGDGSDRVGAKSLNLQ